jgi:ABC-type glycerol-3-phosphate transport system substrate-binding protein
VTRAAVIALVLGLAAAGCGCGLGAGAEPAGTKLTITRDFGSRPLRELDARR